MIHDNERAAATSTAEEAGNRAGTMREHDQIQRICMKLSSTGIGIGTCLDNVIELLAEARVLVKLPLKGTLRSCASHAGQALAASLVPLACLRKPLATWRTAMLSAALDL